MQNVILFITMYKVSITIYHGRLWICLYICSTAYRKLFDCPNNRVINYAAVILNTYEHF